MDYPAWTQKYKEKGLAIHPIGGKYYLYRISSVYDPVKKRAKKITKEYLGRITEEDGLIPRSIVMKLHYYRKKIYAYFNFNFKNLIPYS
jgi:hypothetical protein